MGRMDLQILNDERQRELLKSLFLVVQGPASGGVYTDGGSGWKARLGQGWDGHHNVLERASAAG